LAVDVLHVSPHPDDELIGAPATLMALRDAGSRIVNFAASLGAPRTAADRRRAELEEACRRAGFELVVAQHPFGSLSRSGPEAREAARRALTDELAWLLNTEQFDLVVAPSPHDRHPGHELVARAVHTVLTRAASPDRWWLWHLWGELPIPTTVVPFDAERMQEIAYALDAHRGELDRNDYRALVSGRATASRVLAPELVFGFGGHALSQPYAELTTEAVRHDDGRWLLGSPRILDSAHPFPSPTTTDITWWLNAPSITDRLEATRDQPKPLATT
jgi:LmbE family N-acetylglucosaminyl deacetylase